MRRGPKPAKSKEAKPPVARKSPRDDARVRDLEKRLAEALRREADALGQLQTRDRELAEAQEQQTATAEILRVISASPTDLTAVLNTVVQSAARFCGSEDASLFQLDGDTLRQDANHGPVGDIAGFRVPVVRGTVGGRTVLERRAVHVPDIQAEVEEFPEASAIASRVGHRSFLSVPLLREGTPIGVLQLRRTEVQPFTDKQIALLQTFADQAVIAIENVRLFKELEARNRDLTETLEQQTATGDILRIISTSPTDLQPVLEAVVSSAARFCGAYDSSIFEVHGDHLRTSAHYGPIPTPIGFSFPIVRGTVAGRSLLERRAVHVADLTAEAEEFPEGSALAKEFGQRTVVSAPLLREGAAIGTIALRRLEVNPFTDKQIALLQTFADQAVIAIENVRLFTETKEALERQTATSEILRVISQSPTDLQPVFETILARAVRLCGAEYGNLFRFDGELQHFVTGYNTPAVQREALARQYPMVPARGRMAGRAILERRIIHVPDLLAAPEFQGSVAVVGGFRSTLRVPMMREGEPIGVIAINRMEPGPFTDQQISLLRTFADQAVIAIENVRLFTELQSSNRELRTALDTQTATSDILRVISRSQTDVQPVFDAIVASAMRLLRADVSVLTRVVGAQLELAAHSTTTEQGDAAVRAAYPLPLDSEWPHVRSARERIPLNIADTESDPRVPEALRAIARARGFRGLVTVPLLHRDEALGGIAVARQDAGGFTDDEIALLQTFADQAVIAIENVRLFNDLKARTEELMRSVNQLTALGEVGQAISSTLDLQTVLRTIVARATQLTGVDAGVIYEYDEPREVFVPRATERLEEDIVQMLVATPVRKGHGATGRLAEVAEPIQLADLRDIAEQIPVRDAFIRAGYRALLAVPLVREDHLIGGLTVFRKTPGEFASATVDLLRTFATQSALAIQNARLFREIEDKSRQLEVASQHKSEFLANMSHELRTPLNAIIGFSEVLSERMFGELNEKQDEYLKDIHASGQHLLSLINDILDLSKIEAGRMELELTDFDLPTAIDNALILVRERAGRRSITLQTSVDERLGEVRADERKIRQVVLNLLSNAIKFTPEGGRIEVAAVPKDGSVEVSVSDTGVGIAPEDQEAVFEEFRQVGTADKKVEGTGLGLTLCRKFIELHGGKIWVRSELGAGSTFTFTLLLRR